MQAAYHLINFGVWKDRSEDDKLAAIRDVGYQGVESITIDYEAEPAAARDRLAGFGLELAAQAVPGLLMAGDDAQLTATAKKVARFGDFLGCRTAVIMAPRTDGNRIHSFGTCTEHYEEAARRLNLIGRILADSGVALCLHNHIDHMSESVEEMDLLMNDTDPEAVGICFDTAHAVCAGNDPIEYAERFRERIRYLHLKDTANFLSGRPYFFKNVFLPLGEGVIDFPAILEVLEGYEGWAAVELDGSFSCGDPVKEAAISLKYLNAI